MVRPSFTIQLAGLLLLISIISGVVCQIADADDHFDLGVIEGFLATPPPTPYVFCSDLLAIAGHTVVKLEPLPNQVRLLIKEIQSQAKIANLSAFDVRALIERLIVYSEGFYVHSQSEDERRQTVQSALYFLMQMSRLAQVEAFQQHANNEVFFASMVSLRDTIFTSSMSQPQLIHPSLLYFAMTYISANFHLWEMARDPQKATDLLQVFPDEDPEGALSFKSNPAWSPIIYFALLPKVLRAVLELPRDSAASDFSTKAKLIRLLQPLQQFHVESLFRPMLKELLKAVELEIADIRQTPAWTRIMKTTGDLK